MPNSRGIAVGLTVGLLMLGLLFAGQVLSFASFWLGRALSGAFLILLAVGAGYMAYELYSGWTAGDSSQTAGQDWDTEADTESVDESTGNFEETLTDQELEEELNGLREETESRQDEVMRETN